MKQSVVLPGEFELRSLAQGLRIFEEETSLSASIHDFVNVKFARSFLFLGKTSNAVIFWGTLQS